MTVVDARLNLWEVLAGRNPGKPVGPVDGGLWQAVSERLDPAKAMPKLRTDVEVVELSSARGSTYVMMRSPDQRQACYVRLTPEEWELADHMDGTRSVARLVAEFVRITGRLAPEQVTRVVADLAGNRMLEELPVDAFRPLERVQRKPLPLRIGAGLLGFARGRRVILANIDPLIRILYVIGGRLLFTRVVAVFAGIVALMGAGAFGALWLRGDQSIFLIGDSYLTGALVLFGLNMVALACHELGHALAVKHAGRRVPAAGFLVYFGIPSVFVDTTDVWMAGRRSRLITTLAGPASGLVLAGSASLLALIFPPLAPWAFKLAFAWYLNALFNLNPFLALDGYYLLMDWLEIPNLRVRAIAWLGARLRRQPPRFGDLDREGRLIALYGLLSLAWLLIAVNLAWRLYVDRVSGLVTGLWYAGLAGQVLVLAVCVVLAAPVVYVVAGRAMRGWRRWRQRRRDSKIHRDLPQRLEALSRSALGGLSPLALTALARDARWVRPSDGRPLVHRGAAVQYLYVVLDGVAEARRPGDPGGVIRQRVGAGGVIGLANALTGNPASLAWYTIGATLLAIPSSTVVAAVGDLPAPPPADLAELEDLLDETPQFATLSAEAYLGLTARAEAMMLRPGAPLVLEGPCDAALVGSGLLQRFDGQEVRRGDVLGPYGNDIPGEAALAHTQARIFRLPSLSSLSPLPPRPSGLSGTGTVHTSPGFGAHPVVGYPPLSVPPGPPPQDMDREADGRFERKMWWLLLLVLIFGLTLGGVNFWPGQAWAEMPSDRALVTVSAGTAQITVDGARTRLPRGSERYLGAGDKIEVDGRSSVRLTFRGGGVAVLCADSAATLGTLVSPGELPIRPTGELRLDAGRVLIDTASGSRAFRPLALTTQTEAGSVATVGTARLLVEPSAVQADTGVVTISGRPVELTSSAPTCGDGTALPVRPSVEPSTQAPATQPGETPSPTESPSLSPTPTPTRSASRSPSRSPSAAPPTVPTTTPPTTTNPPAPQPPNASVTPTSITVCNGQPVTFTVTATDDEPGTGMTGRFNPSGASGGPLSVASTNGNSVTFNAQTVTFNGGVAENHTITITVTDGDGQEDTAVINVTYTGFCPVD